MAASWRLVGPPLRPAPADLAHFQAAIARWSTEHPGAPRALILGVTPELCRLDWPAGTQLQALDSSPEMISAVWPGERAAAIEGSWTAAPLGDASQDIILCDGGFGTLSWPEGQRCVLSEVDRMLARGGAFVVRLFAPAGRTGSLGQIEADLKAGAISGLDGLKMRLWGALQTDLAGGVRPRDVVAHIEKLAGSLAWLAEELGWSREHLKTLELHRNSKATYHLIDADGLQEMLAAFPRLAAQSVAYPDHEYGRCCPVVTVTRR